MKSLVIKKIAVTTLVVAALFAPSSPTVASPVPEFEIEVVQPLSSYDNPSAIPAFLHSAPAAACIVNGVMLYGYSCPQIKWFCPAGVSAGALNRYSFQMSYDQVIAGYGSLDSMCVEAVLIPGPNPQLPPAPIVTFTG